MILRVSLVIRTGIAFYLGGAFHTHMTMHVGRLSGIFNCYAVVAIGVLLWFRHLRVTSPVVTYFCNVITIPCNYLLGLPGLGLYFSGASVVASCRFRLYLASSW